MGGVAILVGRALLLSVIGWGHRKAVREAACGELACLAGEVDGAAFQVGPEVTAADAFWGACLLGGRVGYLGDDF